MVILICILTLSSKWPEAFNIVLVLAGTPLLLCISLQNHSSGLPVSTCLRADVCPSALGWFLASIYHLFWRRTHGRSGTQRRAGTVGPWRFSRCLELH